MIVIGAGRVGTALEARAAAHELPCTLVRRDTGWEALEGPQGDPILVAVRNDALAAVVAATPTHRRDDLVFVQNGMIRDSLRALGVARATRGLLYFAVPTKGAPVQPGRTSWFSGAHGLGAARWLGAMGLASQSVDWARFSFYELEKVSWLVVHGLLCTVHECTVGEVAEAHPDAVLALVRELAALGRVAHGVDVPPEYLADKLLDYSRSVPEWRASVKEWEWRDGWFQAQAARFGVDTPVHRELLRAAGFSDRLPQPGPQ
ncbi:MAG: ketopantoate reductase [Myxococcota bacterium]|jgi:ketopantoate reductase